MDATEQIAALESEALNRAVAERVFGLRVVDHDRADGSTGPYTVREDQWVQIGGKTYPALDPLEDYAGDIAAAWRVVGWAEEQLGDGYRWDLASLGGGGWSACVWFEAPLARGRVLVARAAEGSAPLAICKAALVAAGTRKEGYREQT